MKSNWLTNLVLVCILTVSPLLKISPFSAPSQKAPNIKNIASLSVDAAQFIVPNQTIHSDLPAKYLAINYVNLASNSFMNVSKAGQPGRLAIISFKQLTLRKLGSSYIRFANSALINLSATGQPGALATVPFEPLTPREQEVLIEVAHGRSNKQIARRLKIADKTVEVYIYRITRKLRVPTRVGVAVCAVMFGLVNVRYEELQSTTLEKA